MKLLITMKKIYKKKFKILKYNRNKVIRNRIKIFNNNNNHKKKKKILRKKILKELLSETFLYKFLLKRKCTFRK